MPDKSPGREGRKLTLCVALKALASKTSVYSSRREGRNTRSNETRPGGSGGRLVGRVVVVLGVTGEEKEKITAQRVNSKTYRSWGRRKTEKKVTQPWRHGRSV